MRYCAGKSGNQNKIAAGMLRRNGEKMSLAEKIMTLRKAQHWSQEDLADQLGISRQSVSKWESEASVPELDKIVRMSELFGVSTDYLLKEDITNGGHTENVEREADFGETVRPARCISRQEAESFLEETRPFAKKVSLAVSLYICSPILLILLGGEAEYGRLKLGITENMAGGIGCAILLAIVALATIVVISAGMAYSKYEYLEKEVVCLADGLETEVESRKQEFAGIFQRNLVVGIALCILSVIPLFVTAAIMEDEFAVLVCVGLLLAIVAIGVNRIVWAGTIQGSFQKLLQEEDYSPEKKRGKKKSDGISGGYWCLVTGIYLAVSFYWKCWDISWIIWVVAAGIFVLLQGILARKNEA